jgi:hypothetical protein
MRAALLSFLLVSLGFFHLIHAAPPKPPAAAPTQAAAVGTSTAAVSMTARRPAVTGSAALLPANNPSRTLDVPYSPSADHVLGGSTDPKRYVTQDELTAQLEQATNALRSLIYQNESVPGSLPASGGYANELALTNRIDNLSGVTSLTLDNALGTASGGIGATTATGAQAALGLSYGASTDLNAYNIAFWGDSLTPTAASALQQTLQSYNVYNGGVGGNTSAQIATRMVAATGMSNYITVIWAGRNNIGEVATLTGNPSSPDTIKADIASMVASLSPPKRFIVLSVLNSEYPSEYKGGSDYDVIIQLNNDLAALYPNNYLDVRSYLVSQYNPNSPQDVTDFNNDVPPTSLRADAIHLNAAGDALVAQQIANFITTNIAPTYSNTVLSPTDLGGIFSNPPPFGTINIMHGGNLLYNGSTLVQASTTLNDYFFSGAGNLTMTGINNIGIGYKALSGDTTGYSNMDFGYQAGSDTTDGSYDIFLGYQAGQYTTDGSSQVFIGRDAGEQATSTNYDTFVGYNAGRGSASGSFQFGDYNSGYGFGTLSNLTSGADNTANGYYVLDANTTGELNTAMGALTLSQNTTGGEDSGFGYAALWNNTTGTDNVATGYYAMRNNLTGNQNVALGDTSLYYATSSSNNVAVGYQAGRGANNQSNFQNSTLLGVSAGLNLTNGNNNVLLGYQAGQSMSSGSDNIVVGYDIDAPSNTASNQLDIGNLIFGTGINGQGTAISTGNIGIGTTTPYSRLTVFGPDTSGNTSSFVIANSASTTEFNVLDNGNATLAGTLTQNSDQRLKTNIQSLDGSSSLARIDALTPVTFNWIDLSQGSTTQLGFIAQQVQPIFPNLVSTTSATALTPGGTLSLNYIGLISPIVAAIQALSAEIASLENTIAGFATIFHTQELCVGSTCVTPQQFQAMVAAANQSSSSQTPAPSSSDSATSSSADSSATPPVLQVNGDDPAIIQVGTTYTDLGATITGPQADLNLGITTYVNGAPMNPVQLDTSTTGTDTIAYVATDQSSLTSTTTRTVIIHAAPSIVPSADASTTATSTTQ